MENQYQKWVNLSYLVLAVLVGYIVFSLSITISATLDLETKVRNIDLVIRGLSVLIGGVLFLFLNRHQATNQFMNEVVVELSRVTWPTQKETSSATFVVMIMVLISGVFLWIIDSVWVAVLKYIL
jgi:preprotein translocase subunit SecE